ncbi:MAG: tryptophan-rich sensory protein [Firmicutes bacterium]|nr:tryptophan-rich sensory protein [Bacillota bacterium]
MKPFKAFVSFATALAVVFVAGYACSLLITPEGWWQGLNKPSFMPKSFVFEIGWIVIYAFFALTLTITLIRKNLRKVLPVLCVVLVLNALWCAVFFVWFLPLLGLSIIFTQAVALLFLTGYYIKNTKELWLAMIPMLSWYSFLFVLNYAIVILN